MNRRSFLKMAGLAVAMGRRTMAKHLVLLSVSDTVAISGVEWFLYETGLRGSTSERERRCAVRITAAPGIHGWADSSEGVMPDAETAQTIRSRLIDRQMDYPGDVWRELYEIGLPLGTLGAVDIALWDLLGRVEDKPVHALLGTQREKVKAYVTTHFNLGDPSQYVEYALSCRQAGVHGCKIRPYFASGTGVDGAPGLGFPDRDVEIYQAVREAVGPDFACMADNGGTYAFDEALRVGRVLDDLQYTWYESPMPETEAWREQYVALADQLKTPICAPESLVDSYLARLAWVSSKACDIAKIDVRFGGLTPCIELTAACEAAGFPLDLTDIGLDAYPHLQIIAATSESVIKCVELSSLPQTSRVYPGRTTSEPVLDEDGCLAIPQTPGMGFELDWQHIFTHRVA